MLKYYQAKTALVTGAAGFVGSHLVDCLLELGATVIGVDNFLTGRPGNIRHLVNNSAVPFVFIEADVTLAIQTWYHHQPYPDIVFHLASPASPPLYQAHPVATYLVNALGTHQLLSWLKDESPSSRLVLASTSEIYGDPEMHPQSESYWGHVNPNGVRSCYDESKRFGEMVCGVFQREFAIDTRIARIFNTYGPRMNPTDGRIIPNAISQALRREPITVYGSGEQTRSYCFVSDLVEGLVRLGGLADLAGETINLGNPDEYTINDTVAIIQRALGTNLEQRHVALPQDDPKQRCPDITKAQQLLHWQPQVSFAEGLRQTITDFIEQGS